jgi:hypothetical protein
MDVTQAMVERILDRARKSEMGLGLGCTDKQNQHNLSMYATLTETGKHDLKALGMLLVNAYHEKYDLISVFQAALEIVAEEAAKPPVVYPKSRR